jgi:hypothetical protein
MVDLPSLVWAQIMGAHETIWNDQFTTFVSAPLLLQAQVRIPTRHSRVEREGSEKSQVVREARLPRRCNSPSVCFVFLQVLLMSGS